MYDHLFKLAVQPADNPSSVADLSKYDRYLITPVDHDYAGKTSAMWNAAHRRLGIDAAMAMVVSDSSNAPALFEAFRADPRYIGGGLGAGFKELATRYLDELTPVAKAMGAANIVKKTPEGMLVGDNTDGIGYAKSLEDVLASQAKKLMGARVLILGAGGTARAIAFALASKGVLLTIFNRTASKADELARAVNAFVGREIAVGGDRTRIAEVLPFQTAVISTIDNAHSPLDAYSPLGDMPMPVTPESVVRNLSQSEELLKAVPQGFVVSDIRLRNSLVPLLAQADKLGLPILTGTPMVLNQGVIAFEWLYQDLLKEKGVGSKEIAEIMQSAVEPKQ